MKKVKFLVMVIITLVMAGQAWAGEIKRVTLEVCRAFMEIMPVEKITNPAMLKGSAEGAEMAFSMYVGDIRTAATSIRHGVGVERATSWKTYFTNVQAMINNMNDDDIRKMVVLLSSPIQPADPTDIARKIDTLDFFFTAVTTSNRSAVIKADNIIVWDIPISPYSLHAMEQIIHQLDLPYTVNITPEYQNFYRALITGSWQEALDVVRSVDDSRIMDACQKVQGIAKTLVTEYPYPRKK